MSINDYVDSIEDAARYAAVTAGALEVCSFHSDVTIRTGDPDAERHAYALATTIMKKDGTMFMREDVLDAIKHELEMAADDGCPQCQRYIND